MSPWKNNHPKPVIGLAGGIGSGKSTVARALEALGCGVVSADSDAHLVLELPEVQQELRRWWGDKVIGPDNRLSRKQIAAIVFANPAEAQRLNALVHPRVGQLRVRRTQAFFADPRISAVVWDAALLFEVGLHRECDAAIFVEVPYEQRLARVQQTRGWTAEELARRENLQFPLDKKRKLADYVLDNSGEEAASLHQVQRVLSQILARKSPAK